MAESKLTIRYAFTVTELLVVVSIIAILLCVLLPMIGRARNSNNQIVCAANLQQIGRLFAIYAADNKGYIHRGYYPAMPVYGDWIASLSPKGATLHATTDESARRLRCPSDSSLEHLASFTSNAVVIDPTSKVEGMAKISRISSIRQSSEVIHLSDIADRFSGFMRPRQFPIHYPYAIDMISAFNVTGAYSLPYGPYAAISRDRHGPDRINALFFDGHVAAIKSNKMTIEMFDDGSRDSDRAVPIR